MRFDSSLVPYLRQMRSFGIECLPKRGAISPSAALEPVKEKALVCRDCRLCRGRRSVVFGEGPLTASLVFVGEGPGSQEDLQGRPFVGQAGELLTRWIQAMGLSRKEVYITNVVKCRPPMNRPPLPDEIAACSGYLTAQLSTIHPKAICALGKTAAVALVGLDLPMSQLRGKTFLWRETPVVVTFHPAYLLRNRSAMPLVRSDLSVLMKLLKP